MVTMNTLCTFAGWVKDMHGVRLTASVRWCHLIWYIGGAHYMPWVQLLWCVLGVQVFHCWLEGLGVVAVVVMVVGSRCNDHKWGIFQVPSGSWQLAAQHMWDLKWDSHTSNITFDNQLVRVCNLSTHGVITRKICPALAQRYIPYWHVQNF